MGVTDVGNALVQGLAKNFEYALRQLEDALIDCPDDMWETDLWPDEAPTGPLPAGGLNGSAPWFLAYHTLTVLDYDLTGGFERWEPPAPLDENVWGNPGRVFTKDELLGYLDWCREHVAQVLDGLTVKSAARPLAKDHRYTGTPFGVTLSSLPLHTVEHAAQIRQFLTAAGVKHVPRAGDTLQFDLLVRAVTDAPDDEIVSWCGSFGGVELIVTMVFDAMTTMVKPSGDCQVGWDLGDGIEFVFAHQAGRTTATKGGVSGSPCVVSMSAPDFLRYTCFLLPMIEGIAGGRIKVDGDPGELQRMYAK